MKIVFLGLALAFCMSSVQAKTAEQTSSWLENRFPTFDTEFADENVQLYYDFYGCKIFRQQDYYKDEYQDENERHSVDLNNSATGSVVRLLVGRSRGTEYYGIDFDKSSVNWERYKVNSSGKTSSIYLRRATTSQDMPDRIIKALSHLITKCTGSPPKSVVNNIAKDDLF